MTLIIDSKEPHEMKILVRRYAEKIGIETEIQPLNAGDYLWSDLGICIERKEITDFAKSIIEERIPHQMERLKEYPYPYLFISGTINSINLNTSRTWTLNQHYGAILSISAKYHIPIIQLLDDTRLIKAIFDIHEKFMESGTIGSNKPIVFQTKKSDVIDPNYHMYRAIPGIGKKKADEIMKVYPYFSSFIKSYSDLTVKISKPTKEFLDRL